MTNPTFDIGNIIRLSVAFTALDGSAVDPGIVELNLRVYGGTVQTFTYADNQIQKDGTGLYHYDYTPTEAGQYYYRYAGSDGPTAAADSQFAVSPSPATGDWPTQPPC